MDDQKPHGLPQTPEIAALSEPVIDRIMGANLRELLSAVPSGR